jgi:hypothetical protein
MFFERVCFLLLAGIVIVPGNARSSRASLLRAMSLGELTSAADRIVVGTVLSVNAAWDSEHRRIFSTIEIDVDESWKGPADAHRVILVQPGGSVGDIEMTVQGMPNFSTRERALLFLQGRDRLQVVGMGQGKRSLVWDNAGKQWLAQPPENDDVVEVGLDARLRPARRGHEIPVSDLREQVRRAIGSSP